MKAVAVFPGEKKVRCIEAPEPQIDSRTAVKLRVLEVGVCGTDKELCNFVYGAAPAGQDHFVLGHEMLAEVAECGEGVKDLAAGDLVVSAVRLRCGVTECAPCACGHQDFCTSGQHYEHGINEMDGFMVEYVVEEREYLHRVPASLREVGVLTEPLTVAEKAFAGAEAVATRYLWERPAGKSALVLGAGAVGLLGAMKLVHEGYRTTIYSRRGGSSVQAQIADSIGARYISTQECTAAELRDKVGEADIIYEAVGAAQVALDVWGCLAPNGVYLVTGIPRAHTLGGFDAQFAIERLVLENQSVLGIVNAGPESFDAAIRDLEQFNRAWPEALRKMISSRVGVEDFEQAISLAPGGIKHVVRIAG